jgi:hypothetical protein
VRREVPLRTIAPTQTWQQAFARALQTWASVSPLNFHFVADDGSPTGTAGLAQGDSRFGDIRLGAYPWGQTGALAYTYFPSSVSTVGGDLSLNSDQPWNIGSYVDLFSVLLHETGLAVGLGETTVYGTVMCGT